MRSAIIKILVVCMAVAIAPPAFSQAGQSAKPGVPALPPGTNVDVEALLRSAFQMWAGGRAQEAEGLYQSAVETAEKIQDPQQKAELPRALDWQSAFFRDTKRYPEAWAAAERSLGLFKERIGTTDPRTDHMRVGLGTIANASGEYGKGEPYLREVIANYERDPSREREQDASSAAVNLAVALKALSRTEEAVVVQRKAIEILEGMTLRNDRAIAGHYYGLAQMLNALSRFDEAGSEFEGSVKVAERLGSQAGLLGNLLGHQADFLFQRKKYGEAFAAARRSLAIFESLLGPDPAKMPGAVARAGMYAVFCGEELFAAGRYLESEETLRFAIDKLAKGTDVLWLASAQLHLSTTERYLRHLPEAESLARQGLATREEKLPPDNIFIGDAAFTLAAALRWQDKNAEAEPLYRRSLAIREKVYGPDARQVLGDRYGLAEAIGGMGRLKESEELLRQLLVDRERVLGPEDRDVADTIVSLVWNLRRQGRLADAAAFAERPLAIYRKALGPDHPTVVSGLLPLAAVHQDRSEFDQAEQLYKEALRIRLKVYRDNSTNVADSYGDLLRLSLARRQFEEAAGYSAKRLTIYEGLFGKDDPRLIGPLVDLQSLDAFNGDLEAVDGLAKRILAVAERAYGAESIVVANACINVAYAYRLRGKFGNVESYYERPLAIYRKLLGPRHPLVAQALGLLGSFRVATGQPLEAEQLYDEGLAILMEKYGENSPALAGLLTSKALLLMQLKRLDEAESLLERAAGLLRSGAGKPTAALGTVLADLSFVYEAKGRRADMDRLRNEAVEIFSSLYGPNRLPPIAPAPLLPDAQGI